MQVKVYNLPLCRLGTHESILLVHDSQIVQHETWNFKEDEYGGRTYFTNNVNTQLYFPSDSVVSVLR